MTEFLELDSSTSFSVDINSPSKNLKGVLLIFMKERSATKFNRNTEEFDNPKITKGENIPQVRLSAHIYTLKKLKILLITVDWIFCTPNGFVIVD